MKKKLLLLQILVLPLFADAQTTVLLNNCAPRGGADLGNKVIFVLNSGQVGSTDGTVGGTILVPTSTITYNGGTGGTVNGSFIVNGSNGTAGSELFITDGSVGGTSLLKDINPGLPGSNPEGPILGNNNFDVVGTVAYFTADDGVNGKELWKTDGTPGGTVLVKDITPGVTGTTVHFPQNGFNANIGTTLFFSAITATNGLELWKTDGTPGGTSMVKDITPGAGSTTFSNVFIGNGTYVFFIANDGTNGLELWRTDGTAAGTIMLNNINPVGSAFLLSTGGVDWASFVFNNVLYFNPTNGTTADNMLWKSDGTTAGTVLVSTLCIGCSGDIRLVKSVIIGSKFYFSANGNSTGPELYSTNGTAGGTTLVKDINPGFGGSNPDILLPYKPGSDNYLQTLFGGKFFLTADNGTNGIELWISDGTATGTTLVKDINPGTGSAIPLFGTDFFHTFFKFYFVADNGTNGQELWQTDGTFAGTTMVQDIWPGANSSLINFYGIATANNRLVFQADNSDGADIYALNASVTVIPLTLINFTAELKGEAVMLNWSTSQEVNLSHFNIQKSTDGAGFSTIEKAFAKGGNTSVLYSIRDYELSKADKYYYRLEIVDKEGKISYSNVVAVTVKKKPEFVLIAGKNEVTLNFYNANCDVVINLADISGRIIKTLKQHISSGQSVAFPINELAAGAYSITVEYNGNLQTQRFIRRL